MTTGFALGGLDERFFCYVEDVDLGFRLQLAGRPCCYVADAVVHHLGSASSGVGSDFAVYHGHRNLEWLFLKNMPAPLLWRYLPLHLVTWPLLLVWFTARGRGWSFVRAKWDAVRGMGEAWRARTAVQALRVRTPDGNRRAAGSQLAVEKAGSETEPADGSRQPASRSEPWGLACRLASCLAFCLFLGLHAQHPEHGLVKRHVQVQPLRRDRVGPVGAEAFDDFAIGTAPLALQARAPLAELREHGHEVAESQQPSDR